MAQIEKDIWTVKDDKHVMDVTFHVQKHSKEYQVQFSIKGDGARPLDPSAPPLVGMKRVDAAMDIAARIEGILKGSGLDRNPDHTLHETVIMSLRAPRATFETAEALEKHIANSLLVAGFSCHTQAIETVSQEEKNRGEIAAHKRKIQTLVHDHGCHLLPDDALEAVAEYVQTQVKKGKAPWWTSLPE